LVTPDFGQAARRLVAGQPDDSSGQVAEYAAQACARFTSHLARLLGHTGAQVLLRRSVSIASAEVTWLAAALVSGDPVYALRSTMEHQDPDAIRDAFVAVLWAFVALLERLIGPALVARQLEDVWPSVFTYPAKDTP
jgi:hypothetical protein